MNQEEDSYTQRSFKMDLSELTKIVFNRIQRHDPHNVSRIMGFILLNEPSEEKMLQLGFGHENAFLSQIDEAKAMLGLIPPNQNQLCQFPPCPRPISSPPTFNAPHPWDPIIVADHRPSLQSLNFALRSSFSQDYPLCNQARFLNSVEKTDSSVSEGKCLYHPSRMSKRSPSLPELPLRPCLYFNKGYCKHGENCRYLHGQPFSDGYSRVFSSSLNELQGEGHGLSAKSLEKLELEIAELLKSRRGMPVSIALLPMLYYEKYGRCLQPNECLPDSQRYGKAGFSLTKLISTLKNSFRIIYRPHGHHSVILADDAYCENQSERSEMPATSASLHQIYLTFPAQSTFNEEDVSNYFKQFGPVKDVRIPCQEKRMYGFVSFIYPESVSDILMRKTTHYICGSRVLVKPYKEKLRMIDRANTEKSKVPMNHPSLILDLESRTVQQKNAMDRERRRAAGFNLGKEPANPQPCFHYDVEDSKVLAYPSRFPAEEHLFSRLTAINIGLSSSNNNRSTINGYSGKERNKIELPDSPFASPPDVGSST